VFYRQQEWTHHFGGVPVIFKSSFWIPLILLCAIGLLSCSNGSSINPNQASPVIPDITNAQTVPVESAGHSLWGYFLVRIDEKDYSAEIIPVRATSNHWNIIQFLEQAPCTDCFKLAGITPNPDGTLNVNVSIKHPFTNLNLTGFDVRGIAMFNGSHQFPESGLVMSDRTLGEGEVVNADGYTTLYNPTTVGHGFEGYIKGKLATATAPSSTLNAFKRFITNDPANTRNAFYAGDEIVVTYQIDMPDPPNPWVFGYAVDASWAPPISKPVDDPMTDFGPEANCPEAWGIVLYDSGPGLNSQGGTIKLQIDVYDWQEKDEAHPVLVECPELFDGEIEGTWISDYAGFARYEAMIENAKLATAGEYLCIINKEANENNPSAKPWLNLTAWNVCRISVDKAFNPVDVTPPWLNVYPYDDSDVCIEGNHAYIAGNGLFILDISDPLKPVWVNWVDTPDIAEEVTVSGGYAYVADGYSGLQIIDIDPPESAIIVKSVDTEYATGVAVSGGYAYVSANWNGLQIIDIDPPESAFIVNEVDMPDFTNGVAVSEGYAYVAANSSGLQIIDIDPPESAYIVNSFDTLATDQCVTVSGGYVYVADQLDIQIIDIDPLESAYIVNSVDTSANPQEILVSGGYTYLANGSGLQIIDTNPPESACVVKSVETTETAFGIAVLGGYAFVASGCGLQIIDINPPESAIIVKSFAALGYTEGVALLGGCAYVADGQSGLQIVDINPPEWAHVVNSVDTPGRAYGVAVSGGYAYIADYHKPPLKPPVSGFRAIDIDPPDSAYIVKSVDLFGGVGGVAVSGEYSYVAADDLQIIDIDPPESAYIVQTVDWGGNAEDVAVLGGYAYVANIPIELQIIAIDPPESAYIVKSVDAPGDGNVRGVAVSGGYAYVADWGKSRLLIIDIDPPESAFVVKIVHMPDKAYGVAVSEGYAYVADLDSGLQIVDIDPPASAYIISSIDTPGSALKVAVSGDYAYVADGEGGLRIIKLW